MRITVCIPVKNGERFIAFAIESVLMQTCKDWTLLIIDDGSTDRTLEVVQGYASHQVRILHDGRSMGLASRLNQAAGLCETELLARMDADDIMLPERLELQSQFMAASNFDVVGGAAYTIDDANQVTGLMTPRLGRGFHARHSFIHPSVLGKTSWFRANPYSEEPRFMRAEDAELWMRTHSHSSFGNLDQPVLFYRKGGKVNAGNYVFTACGVICAIQLYCRGWQRFAWTSLEALKVIWRVGLGIRGSPRPIPQELVSTNHLASLQAIARAARAKPVGSPMA